jgi:ribosomal protein S27AE
MNAVDTQPQDAPVETATRACPRCGAALAPEQDWCLKCGAPASTRIAPAPSWRAPLAIVGVVLALAAAGIAIAFLELTNDAERVAQAPEATPAAAAPAEPPAATGTPAAPSATPTPEGSAAPADPNATPAPSAEPQVVGTWPDGVESWTVVVMSSESEEPARKRAEELAAGGTSVGVLKSDDYSSLRAGYWVVFSGRYESTEEAQAAAASLGGTAPGAYARLVKP